MANRVTEVNRALKARGIKDKLYRGNGYYYFWGVVAAGWYTSSVPVCHASDVSVQSFLDWYEYLKNSPDNF